MTSFRSPDWIQAIRSRPRLMLALAVGLISFMLIDFAGSPERLFTALLSWNIAIIFYLILIFRMMRQASPEDIHRRALDQDAGRNTVLVLALASVAISLAGIGFELVVAKNLNGKLKFEHIALTIGTVAVSWLFAHVMFAQHYAHEFYEAVLAGKPGGLDFPGEAAPHYTDFVYFALVLGTSGQTADVSFSTRDMRKIGAVHSVFSFAYNTALIALTINIASGLL